MYLSAFRTDCVKGLTSPPEFAECGIEVIVQDVISTLQLVGVELTMEGLHKFPKIVADNVASLMLFII